MKILIADDHELVRDTICAFLSNEPGLRISAAADFDGAAELMNKEGPFDLVLLDYSMPGMNGLDGLAKAKELNFGSPVAILSGTASRDVAEEALASGAAGFLPKSLPAKSLIHAVRFMAAGEQYAPVQFMTEKEEKTAHPLEEKTYQARDGGVEGPRRGALQQGNRARTPRPSGSNRQASRQDAVPQA